MLNVSLHRSSYNISKAAINGLVGTLAIEWGRDMTNIDFRLALHRDFWNGKSLNQLPVSYRIGDYFLSDKFKANLPLLKPGTIVTPEMIHVDDYLEDYERMYTDCERIGQTGFFTADPCTGFPWVEAMLGCPVIGANVAFVTDTVYDSIEDIPDLYISEDNSWYQKYLEFVDKLTILSAGRFPVGQPIMRGVSDVIGAMVGQEEMSCALLWESESIKKAFYSAAMAFKGVIEEQYKRLQVFNSGYSIGFYHLWAPGRIIWYQDDLAALMSPGHYNEFLHSTSEFICDGYDYSLVHLHPSGFYHLGGILKLKKLSAVQINKDIGGPGIKEMLTQFKQVLDADKCLIIFGDLTIEELKTVFDNLPMRRIFLNIVAPDVDSACRINDFIVNNH